MCATHFGGCSEGLGLVFVVSLFSFVLSSLVEVVYVKIKFPSSLADVESQDSK